MGTGSPERWLPGRAVELDALSKALDEARAGRPGLVFVEGEPGVGKSTLLNRFAGWCPGARVLELASGSTEDYDPVAEAARALRRAPGVVRGGWISRLGVEWLGALPVWGDLVAAAVATVRALTRRRGAGRVEDVAVAALVRAARRRVLVLLLDDLDHAEPAKLKRLETLWRAGAGRRLLVVGAFTIASPGAAPATSRAGVARLAGLLEGARTLRLGPLDREAVRAHLAARYPGASLAPDFVAWLMTRTGGHPGRLADALAALAERGVVSRGAEGWKLGPVPATFELPASGAAGIDLSALDPGVARAASAAAVLGDAFDALALSRLLEEDELVIEDRLALAAHHGLVVAEGEVEYPDGDISTGYHFASPSLRAALYGALSPELRRRLERRRVSTDRPQER